MPSLQQLQTDFLEAIINPGNSHNFLENIKSTDRLSAKQRLLIYQNSIEQSFINTLVDIYPVCCNLVGVEFFSKMSQCYIKDHHSDSPNLGDYGEDFSKFIDGFAPAQQVPYLSETALLEWNYHRAFHAPDFIPVDFSLVLQKDFSEQQALKFILNPTLKLLKASYPVDKIWLAHQGEEEKFTDIDLNDGPVYLIVWRDGIEIKLNRIEKTHWELLQAIKSGENLLLLCENFPSLDMPSVLPEIICKGWIVDYH